jgi:hypothetical protein
VQDSQHGDRTVGFVLEEDPPVSATKAEDSVKLLFNKSDYVALAVGAITGKRMQDVDCVG